MSPDIWQKMGFIVEAERAILCFIIFFVPALSKDTACYVFGLSPMPFWVFAVISTLGRLPGTWVLIRPRRPHSGGRLCSSHPAHGHCRGGGAAAVLLPEPGRRMVRWQERDHGGKSTSQTKAALAVSWCLRQLPLTGDCAGTYGSSERDGLCLAWATKNCFLSS